jgi:hypothetical protein
MSDHTDFEELEQIPWAALAAGTSQPRYRYLALGMIGIVLVAVAVWAVTRPGDASTSTAVTVATTTPPVAAATIPVPATTAAPAVYSEADLMAIDVTAEERLAVMHADWLVRDYLTIDDDPVVTGRVDALLAGVERDDTGTYVEWVEPFAVSSDEPGRYRVEVVYRLLAETEGGFVRMPAGAVAVELSIDPDGTTRIEAPPEPVPVPAIVPLDE